LMANYR